MVVIIPNKTKKKVILTQDEIDLLIDELGRIPHDLYTFLNYDKIINKLKNARELNTKGR